MNLKKKNRKKKNDFEQRKNMKQFHLMKISKKLGRTFLSKLLLKLTNKMNIPSFYLQILRYETCNRTNEEIIKVMSWFKTKGNFDSYVNLKEFDGKINNLQIIFDIASQAYYKYKKSFSFIKKANECGRYFYLILNGNIQRINLVYIKKKISVETYLYYICKLGLLQEKIILEKCSKLNKDIIDINIDINNPFIYVKNDISYDLKKIIKKARDELINKGFDFSDKKIISFNSIDNYINIGEINLTQSRDIYAGYEFYIGCYVKNGTLMKGDFIGDLSRNENYENSTYICKTDCDIVSLDKKYTQILKFKLYDYMQSKIKNIFIQLMKKIYILKDISEDFCLNNILPYLIFKTFKKGEKIFSQFSTYEGIYLIFKGQIKLNLSQTSKELSNTLSNLTYANGHFKEYASQSLNNLDVINEFNLSHIIKNRKKPKEINKEQFSIYSSNKYNEGFNVINDIEFYCLGGGESLGFNELIDVKTGLYNFNAECISDDVDLFFISRKDFDYICEKETGILKSVIKLVELRAKALIGKISLYKKRFKYILINSFKNNERTDSDNINNMNNINNMGNISNIKTLQNYNSFININSNINKENNFRLFKNNYLLKYFRNSKFFDYATILNNNKKIISKIQTK